jgi:hypothetical protein
MLRVNGAAFTGKCSCAIYDKRPSFCQQGPLEEHMMPGCGYKFVNGVRTGECKRCSLCCVLPRKGGSPFGVFHPLGSRCQFLKVEE